MKHGVLVVMISIFLVVAGCSSEMAKRAAYESLQNKAQIDCQQNPGSGCPEKKSYDEYQRSLNEGNTRGK
jgi:hypothetical protein